MGLISGWHTEFLNALESLNLRSEAGYTPDVYELEDQPIAFHLLTPATASLNNVLDIVQLYTSRNIQLINIWEDQWLHHQTQVYNRLASLAGTNKRIYARNCQIVTVNSATADAFIKLNHLQGIAKAKYRLALKKDNILVAISTFNMRPMPDRGEAYNSAELIRFCNAAGTTVTGGLTRLISYFIAEYKPDDIMTYADKDWSDGKGYLQAGFTEVGETLPLFFWVAPDGTRFTPNRLPVPVLRNFESSNYTVSEDFLISEGFTKAFNTGNKKFIRFLRNVR